MDPVFNFIGAYALWLIVVGTIGNIVTAYICYELRKSTTFVFLTFIAASDLVASYFWNVNGFTISFTNVSIIGTNIYLCRIGNYIQFSFLLISAWLLVKQFDYQMAKIEKQVTVIFCCSRF